MRDEKLSKDFRRSEFACQGANCCGGSAPISMALISILQQIRTDIDMPVGVTSGFRCRAHNSRTPNAVPDSYHTLGHAADITAACGVARLYEAAIEAIDHLGYGHAIAYPERGFVHVDIHDR